MPRRSKKQQHLQGEGFFDTIKSWGQSVVNAYTPKLIASPPTPYTPPASDGLPDKSILKTIADNSYKQTQNEMTPIAGYTMLLKTPTLVIYQKDGENMMVIGVRGTADFRDFKAWFSTAFNVIPDSARFKEDIDVIARFQQEYPVSAYTYYATGHSLGGTLIDELIKKGMVKEARTYNPAIETSDIPDVALSQKNHRIYADGDPLYLLQGRYDHPAEVRNSYKYYPSSMYDFVPGYDKYKQHILANPVFAGGEEPEYDKLKWGSFTKQFNAYNKKHPKNELKNLKEFAQMVVANPDKFAKTTEKRARFYMNVILKGSGNMKKQVVMNPQDYYKEHRNIVGLLDKTGKALQREAQAQKAEATATAKHLGAPNPFYHLQGRGIMDDIKHGIQSVIGKPPVVAHKVWTPAEQADINRRQHIIDVDKQREKMVSSRVDYAFKNLMENAQRPNVLQGYYKSLGTDNVKDYTARVKELATKAAAEFYPY
jgi:hypothetical protein